MTDTSAGAESYGAGGPSPHRAGALFRIGETFGGPILVAYVSWVLRQAVARGVARLYFIARDGQVLLDTAKRINAKLGLPVELRYLYGSRQAWHLPTLAETPQARGETDLDWISIPDPLITLRVVSRRLDVEPEFLTRCLARLGFPVTNLDADLPPNLAGALMQHLFGDAELHSRIMDSARRARGPMVGYLRQEGLFDDVPWAVVDLGWKGNMQRSLSTVLRAEGYAQPLTGFYFGLFRGGSPNNLMFPYFFGPGRPEEHVGCSVPFINILEILTAADHGTTLGYSEEQDGTVRPTLKEELNTAALSWGISAVREGMASFVDNASSSLLAEDTVGAHVRIRALMHRLREEPTFEEAEAIGDFLFSSDQAETKLRRFAPALSFRDAMLFMLFFHSERKACYTFWTEGSKVRSGPSVQGLFAVSRAVYRFFPKRLFHVLSKSAMRAKGIVLGHSPRG